jgi:hypothetical protein
MSTEPRDLTLERLNRLTQAVADLMDSQTAQGRNIVRLLEGIGRIEVQIGALAKDVRELAAEQALLGNRVENAFNRALRVDIRMDALEDRMGGAP